MLVLSRKPGETVMIGHNIGVKVLEVRGDRVKLGFDCPDDIPVLRGELTPHMTIDPSPDTDEALSIFHPEFA